MSTEVLARHGKSFRFAGSFLSEKQLERAAALYSLCREVDDIADESDDPKLAHMQLKQILDDLGAVSKNTSIGAQATSLLSEQGQLAFADLIKGVMSDTSDVLFETEAELLQYCYRVAGTVGLMMCDILGVTDRRAFDYAVSLGVAMQLTNIARDICEDAMMGRRYIPSDWVGELSPESIVTRDSKAQLSCPSATKRLLVMAESYYQFSNKGLYFLPFRARLAITVASNVYREIGCVIRHQNHYDIWKGRAMTTKLDKCRVALGALSVNVLSPSFYGYSTKPRPPAGLIELSAHW